MMHLDLRHHPLGLFRVRSGTGSFLRAGFAYLTLIFILCSYFFLVEFFIFIFIFIAFDFLIFRLTSRFMIFSFTQRHLPPHTRLL